MPRVRILLPRSLRQYWEGDATVEVEASSLAEALRALGARHPGLRERIVDDQGRVREFVHVFVNRDAVRGAPEDVPLREGDAIHVLPSVAGGRGS